MTAATVTPAAGVLWEPVDAAHGPADPRAWREAPWSDLERQLLCATLRNMGAGAHGVPWPRHPGQTREEADAELAWRVANPDPWVSGPFPIANGVYPPPGRESWRYPVGRSESDAAAAREVWGRG